MDLRERLKAKMLKPPVATAPVAPAPEPEPASEPAPPPPKPKVAKAKAPASPKVSYLCGHTVGLANLAAANCPACAKKAAAARRERRQAQRTAKEKAEAPIQMQQGRLPDGAAFAVTFNAETKTWTGTLTINEQTFTGRAGGVFRLLAELDATYRASLPVTVN